MCGKLIGPALRSAVAATPSCVAAPLSASTEIGERRRRPFLRRRKATTQFEIFAGIDWPTQTHQVAVVDADGKILGERAFAHNGEGLAAMAD